MFGNTIFTVVGTSDDGWHSRIKAMLINNSKLSNGQYLW